MARPNSLNASAAIALVLAAVTLLASWTLTLEQENSGLMISSFSEENGTETAPVVSTAR